MRIGFHTDAFNSSYWSFEQCLQWAKEHQIHWIECGAIDGVSWIHGLGYQPHIALWEDPLLLRRKMEKYEVRFSQIDAAFPLSKPEGASLGVEYILHTVRWAKLVGCPRVDTTDDRACPEGMTETEALQHMRKIYERIVRIAEAYEIVINIEPHGYFTTKPEFMEQMLRFVDSPYLQMNMDTGNTFIAGLNADNIRKCLEILRDHGYEGVLSIECEGAGGPMIEESVNWLRQTLKELGIEEGT